MTDSPTLKVQRVDQPRADLLVLGLYGGERLVLLLHAGDRATAFGTATERPRGLPADGRVRQLRKRLVGTRLLRILTGAWGIGAEFEYTEGSLWLIARASTHASERFRLQPATPSEEPMEQHLADTLRDARYLQLGDELLNRMKGDAQRDQRVELKRRLKRLRKRLEARERAILGDIARMDAAPELRANGQMILASSGQLAPGQKTLTAVDYTREPPQTRTLELDPRIGWKAEAERLFHRARRLERGRHVADKRLRETTEELADLGQWEQTLDAATTPSELASVVQRLGQQVPAARGRRNHDTRRLPYRRYEASLGRMVWVGRGARDNDTLTLQHARPWDLWLHARDVEGAHVIVPLSRGESCPAELLVDAATLAAHHSRARGQQTIDVQYVERRHVRKPRGFPPGAVRVEREKVLRLRLESARLRRLIDALKSPA